MRIDEIENYLEDVLGARKVLIVKREIVSIEIFISEHKHKPIAPDYLGRALDSMVPAGVRTIGPNKVGRWKVHFVK